MVFGRSIGSGPATHLAAHRNPGALVLISPYTSIKAVVKDIAGQLVSTLFAERFNNIEEIEKVECPCLFIHGKKDTIIPWSHSKALYAKCRSLASVSFSETMGHNAFKSSSDIIVPIKNFIRKREFKPEKSTIALPDYIYKIPLKREKTKSRDFSMNIFYNFADES